MSQEENDFLEWWTETTGTSGGTLDLEILKEFMTWLEDNEGRYMKEEKRALFKQFMDSRKDKSAAHDRMEYDNLENSFGNVLQFYGVELQSHAGQLLGLSILIFTIIQAWGQLGMSTVARDPILFGAFVGVLGLGVVHQTLRLYRYGKEASGIMHSSLSSFLTDKGKRIAEGWPWEKLSKLTKVTLHSDARFEQTGGLRKVRVYFVSKKGDKFRQSLWPFSAGFTTAYLFSYFFIFSASDWSNWQLILGALLALPVLVGIVDLLRWKMR